MPNRRVYLHATSLAATEHPATQSSRNVLVFVPSMLTLWKKSNMNHSRKQNSYEYALTHLRKHCHYYRVSGTVRPFHRIELNGINIDTICGAGTNLETSCATEALAALSY